MNTASNQRGMLRAGDWGNGFDLENHAALNQGSAGTQSLARSVSRGRAK